MVCSSWCSSRKLCLLFFWLTEFMQASAWMLERSGSEEPKRRLISGPSAFAVRLHPSYSNQLQVLQFSSGPSCFFFVCMADGVEVNPVLTFLASWLLRILLLGLWLLLLLDSAAFLLGFGWSPAAQGSYLGHGVGGGFTPNWILELTLGGLSTCRLTCGFPSGCLVFFQQFLAGWLPPYVTGVGGSLGVSISLTGFFRSQLLVFWLEVGLVWLWAARAWWGVGEQRLGRSNAPWPRIGPNFLPWAVIGGSSVSWLLVGRLVSFFFLVPS